MSIRRLIVVPLVLAVLAGAACTGDGGPKPSDAASTSPGDAVVTDVRGPVEFEPGQFRYEFNDVTATLVMDGSGGTLAVKNGSGAELGAPGLYVLTAGDERRDATVEAAAAIPDGSDAEFTVTFPEDVTTETVGLVVLLFGESNYGNLAPVPVSPPPG